VRVSRYRSPQSHSSLCADRRARAARDRDRHAGQRRAAAIRPATGRRAAHPATVIQAYKELEAQGFVEIRHGAGTFVRELAPGRRARERSQQAVALVRKLLAEARRSGVSLAELQRALETELGAKTT